MQMRWRCPPENSCGYLTPSAGSSPTRRSSSPTRASVSALSAGQAEGADRIGDDAIHAPARIEAGERVLEDHLQAAAQLLPLGLARRRPHVDAVEGHAARGRRQQADHHPGDRRLARAGFAHQSQRLAALDREGDVRHRLEVGLVAALDDAIDPGPGDVEHAAQALRLDERRPAHAGSPVTFSATSQQAASDAPAGMRSGRSVRQRAKACAQRGWKAQPAGMALSRGIEPGICVRRSARAALRRDRAHQALRIGMARPLHHVAHRADLDDAAGIHDRHAVGGLGDHAHVVRDQHDGRAALTAQPLEQLDDLRLDRHVERRGRLVGDQQLGLGAQGQRQHHALAHAARELVRVAVDARPRALDADLLQQRDGPLARLGLRDRLVRADRLDDLVADPVKRVEAGQRVLEHHADAGAAHLAHLVGRGVVDALPVEPHLAAGDASRRLEQADHGGAGQRLAGARFTDHAQHLAGGDVEGDPVHRDELAAAAEEGDLEVADGEDRLAHRHVASVPLPKFAKPHSQRPERTSESQGTARIIDLSSVIQIEKFAPTHVASPGEFLDRSPPAPCPAPPCSR